MSNPPPQHSLPYRLLFDSSNDAMFVIPLTDDGQPQCFVDVNARACRLLGYSRDELLKLSPLDLDGEFSLKLWQETVAALSQQSEVRFTFSFNRRRKRTLWIEVSLRRTESDGMVLALAIARDVTRQVEAERALRENERDLRA